MSELTEQLERERQLIDAATEGPWIAEYSGEQGNCVLPSDAQSTREAVAVTRLYDRQADAEFIAHARTALPVRNAQIKAVLELADGWEARGESDMAFSKTIDDESISAAILEDGAGMVERARHIRRAIEGAGA